MNIILHFCPKIPLTHWSFKATIIDILYNNNVLNGDVETMCNVKGVSGSDEQTENYHLNPQLCLALRSFIVCSSLFFGCPAHNFTVLVHSHRFHTVVVG